MSFDAPEGKVTMQPNHHLENLVLIGEVQKDDMFKILKNKGLTCDWAQKRSDAGKFKI